ncbi:hypothetical protein [Streptomyces katsurahamanus]|uniref:Integral membrane protein n=1 Tax=Streptomyces katsurahamanus TaxID=2577098 RepID=A0ABW9P0Z0_9ACTN|nr:hypothetical protein [Streptomyces katsurahamanus]MQS38989.1 hypothetical protein [Streptomyces katsurahamanus]
MRHIWSSRIPRWSPQDTTLATAVSTVQIAVAGTAWLITTAIARDDHGIAQPVLGWLCLLVASPLVLPVAGLLYAVLLPLPVAAIAPWAARRAGGPEWGWRALLTAVFAAVHAVPWAWLGAGYPAAWAWIAAGAVPPLLAVDRARRRTEPVRRVWRWTAAATALLVPATVALLALATMAGVLKEYEPPELTAAQLAGEWAGPGDRLLSLGTDGRAAFADVPVAVDDSLCDGAGRWSLDTSGHRDEILLGTGDCGGEIAWLIGGTEKRPELSVFLGDPDSGDLFILTRQGGDG